LIELEKTNEIGKISMANWLFNRQFSFDQLLRPYEMPGSDVYLKKRDCNINSSALQPIKMLDQSPGTFG
jgi:hypothetical protein